jgi:hypothetical protein
VNGKAHISHTLHPINVLLFFFRNFLFPSDVQLDLEYWAESGDYDEEELHEV